MSSPREPRRAGTAAAPAAPGSGWASVAVGAVGLFVVVMALVVLDGAAVVVPALMIGAALVVVAALLPRLSGPAEITPTGLKVNIASAPAAGEFRETAEPGADIGRPAELNFIEPSAEHAGVLLTVGSDDLGWQDVRLQPGERADLALEMRTGRTHNTVAVAVALRAR